MWSLLIISDVLPIIYVLFIHCSWLTHKIKNYNDGQFVDAWYLRALQGNNIIFIMSYWLALRIFLRTYLRVDLSFLKEWEMQHFPPGLGLRYRLADADVPLSSNILGLFIFGMKGESHLACLNTSCTLSESNVSRVARATLLLRILIIEEKYYWGFSLFFHFIEWEKKCKWARVKMCLDCHKLNLPVALLLTVLII